MTPHQGPPTSRSTAPFNVGSHQPQQQHRATSATSLWIPTCFPEDPVGPPQAPVSAHCQLQEDANRGRWPLSATAVEGPPPLLPPSDWGWPAASSQRSSKQYSPSSQTRPPSMSAGQTQPASALPVLESAPFAGRDHLYAHKQSNLSYLMSQPSSSLPPAPPAEQRWSSLVASAEATIPPPPSGDLRPRSSSTSTTESSSSQNSSQSGDLFDDLDPTPVSMLSGGLNGQCPVTNLPSLTLACCRKHIHQTLPSLHSELLKLFKELLKMLLCPKNIDRLHPPPAV